MSEPDILNLMAMHTADQTAIFGLIISLHFAVIVGIFYFLHKAGRAMKVGFFLLYTLGYALLLGLMVNASEMLFALGQDLAAFGRSGKSLSHSGVAAMRQTVLAGESWVSFVANISLIVLWIATTSFLFLWKPPVPAEAHQENEPTDG